MRITAGQTPGGFDGNRLPVIWLARHPSGCALTIEKCGPCCTIVWRTYPHRKAHWFEEMIVCDSLVFEENQASAEMVAEGLMLEDPPEHILGKNVVAERRAKQREEDEARLGAGMSRTGRKRRKSDEQIRETRIARQARWKDKQLGLTPEQWRERFEDHLIDAKGDDAIQLKTLILTKVKAEDFQDWCDGEEQGPFKAWLLTLEARTLLNRFFTKASHARGT